MICILNTSKTGPIKQGDNIDIKEKVWIIVFVFVLKSTLQRREMECWANFFVFCIVCKQTKYPSEYIITFPVATSS
jgi:hypothetical protein